MQLRCALLFLSFCASLPMQAQKPRVDFVKEIQPLFRAACYQCHGPASQMAQLRLDSKALAFQGGISGNIFTPRNGSENILIERLSGGGGKVRMPLQGAPFTPEQVDLVRRWIAEGANWPDDATVAGAKIARHWSYEKPVRPPLPTVQRTSWPRNPIDRFILARLEREGLSPSREAARETLIRRVSLDLTGLPPTIQEVDAFVADQSPRAYENVVDRLLASPHYGERWARPWLDLARYADTNGFADNRRTIWKYRDWVVGAFNRDLSFDKFTIEQIAGDMLPGATLDQKIATGFHRNTMFNDEGGVDQDEARWLNNVDRAATTATVWMGTTLGCAQCHNHKYDPFTQNDFYRLLSFFETADYNVEGEGRHQLYIEPVLELPTEQQAVEQKRLREEITRLETLQKTPTDELKQAQLAWERDGAPRQALWRPLEPLEHTCASGASIKKGGESSLVITPSQDKEECTFILRANRQAITALQVELFPRPDTGVEVAALRLQPGADGSGAIHLRPTTSTAGSMVYEMASPADASSTMTVILSLARKRQDAAASRFRLSAAAAPGSPPAEPLPDSIRPILETAHRTKEQADTLAAYYRSIAPILQPARDQVVQLSAKLAKLPIVTTLVMHERQTTEKRTAHLRIRGSYLSKGELVEAGAPALFAAPGEPSLGDRLALARWLVSDQNPLVARVTVNRFWEQIFGRGIVETAEDFGTRGAAPTHRELLDWLAVEFASQGWSMKSLHRLIVTSAAYRQASEVTPALLERDPDNRLLARGPRFRLDGETIRDSALAASGLLEPAAGGPPVFPYQPEGVWNQPYYKDYQWVNSEGADGYRRGIYTFWRRTAPYPSFVNFDAPSREFCSVRRIRTNTPLQALTTLNDPAFFMAAKAMAARIAASASQEARDRAELGFRLCVSRRPSASELDQIVALYTRQLTRFKSDEAAARELGGKTARDAAELAAWTVVANVLFNLDETLTKE